MPEVDRASLRRAWGWVAALEAGEATPWSQWAGTAEAPDHQRLPGAQQLELLRRLNAKAAGQGRRVDGQAADRVLRATPTGRGRSDLPLVGVEDPKFGVPAVDPAQLPAGDLLRIATHLIADDVARVAAAQGPRRTERTIVDRVRAVPQRFRDGFVVAGIPWVARAWHDALADHGIRQGGRRPTAYLLADDLGTVLAHAWAARSFDQGGSTWQAFVNNAAQAGHLPPRADIARMARSAVGLYGAPRLVVVTDPGALARRLGLPSTPRGTELGANAIELVRLVGEPLGLLVDAADKPHLLRTTLSPRLNGTGGALPTVPVRHEPWLHAQAERLRHELEAGGYPVLGGLDLLVPGPLAAEPVLPVPADTLDLALDLLLDPVGTTPRPHDKDHD